MVTGNCTKICLTQIRRLITAGLILGGDCDTIQAVKKLYFSHIDGIIILAAVLSLCFLLAHFMMKNEEESRLNSVKQVMWTIKSAQDLYKSQHSRFASMRELYDTKMVGPSVALPNLASSKYGYRFTVEIDGSSWSCNAEPVGHDDSGRPTFHIDERSILSVIPPYPAPTQPMQTRHTEDSK